MKDKDRTELGKKLTIANLSLLSASERRIIISHQLLNPGSVAEPGFSENGPTETERGGGTC